MDNLFRSEGVVRECRDGRNLGYCGVRVNGGATGFVVVSEAAAGASEFFSYALEEGAFLLEGRCFREGIGVIDEMSGDRGYIRRDERGRGAMVGIPVYIAFQVALRADRATGGGRSFVLMGPTATGIVPACSNRGRRFSNGLFRRRGRLRFWQLGP